MTFEADSTRQHISRERRLAHLDARRDAESGKPLCRPLNNVTLSS
jgi:hypothetical protein